MYLMPAATQNEPNCSTFKHPFHLNLKHQQHRRKRTQITGYKPLAAESAAEGPETLTARASKKIKPKQPKSENADINDSQRSVT